MKKKLLAFLITFGVMIAGTASASLWSFYNGNLPSIAERTPIAQEAGISNYTGTYSQNIALEAYLRGGMEVLGATPTPTSSAAIKYVEAPDFYAYSPAVAGDTTITINNLTDIYGNKLTMADFGNIGYGRIDPDGAEVSESFTFTGVTANSDGTYTLTGVKSVLAKYPYTQTSGLVRSHSINAIVRFTNTAAFYDNFANKENNEIIDGDWEFTAFPYFTSATTLPDADGEFATKYYVDTVGAGGFTSANVSTTRGLSVDGSSPEKVGINASSTTGMSFDSNGALYQKVSSSLYSDSDGIGVTVNTLVAGGVATSTPTANAVPIADASGKLDSGWIGFGDGSDGALNISSGTTTINLGGLPFVTKNYTSLSITGTGKLNFSNPAPQGTVVIINVKNDVVLSSSADASIDLRGMGSTVASTTGALDAVDHRSKTIYGSTNFYASPLNQNSLTKVGAIIVSAGTQGTAGGTAPGLGAGGLIMRLGGNLTGTSTILANGGNGVDTDSLHTTAGGGGSGSDVYIGYKGDYTGTITINNSGGRGGNAVHSSDGSVLTGGAGAGSSLGAGGSSNPNNDGSPGANKAGGGGSGSCTGKTNPHTGYGGAGGASDGGLIEKIYQ